uniref:Erecta n=1 Tax=Rhizophora mucronata TaxID=61149 RepID=A0A2P2IVG1_RHIMU
MSGKENVKQKFSRLTNASKYKRQQQTSSVKQNQNAGGEEKLGRLVHREMPQLPLPRTHRFPTKLQFPDTSLTISLTHRRRRRSSSSAAVL